MPFELSVKPFSAAQLPTDNAEVVAAAQKLACRGGTELLEKGQMLQIHAGSKSYARQRLCFGPNLSHAAW